MSTRRERERRRQREIHKKVLCPHRSRLPPPPSLERSRPTKSAYERNVRTPRLPLPHYAPLSLTSRSLRREIFILIVDRLTAAERAFSTPPPSPLGQSARVPPAILVHTDAARTCTVLLLPSPLRRAAYRGGCSLADVCARNCTCVCVRASQARSRTPVHRGRVFPLENGRRARKLPHPSLADDKRIADVSYGFQETEVGDTYNRCRKCTRLCFDASEEGKRRERERACDFIKNNGRYIALVDFFSW